LRASRRTVERETFKSYAVSETPIRESKRFMGYDPVYSRLLAY
jgi:hypothetical protein